MVEHSCKYGENDVDMLHLKNKHMKTAGKSHDGIAEKLEEGYQGWIWLKHPLFIDGNNWKSYENIETKIN